MELIKNTKIKPYGKANLMYAIFYCPKCKKEVEKCRNRGLLQKSCGCIKDYTGETINGFKIIKDFKNYSHTVIAQCRHCENIREYHTVHEITSGAVKSCGCKSSEIRRAVIKTHGNSHKRMWKIWQHMKERCYSINNPAYKNYGKRGIKICEEWMDYEQFERWSLSNGYSDKLSIDRINNDGNYEPLNCRWTTQHVQSRNTRKIQRNNTSGYRGVNIDKRDNRYRAYIKVNYRQVIIGYSKDPKECALMYDKYIDDNKLEHTKNFTKI